MNCVDMFFPTQHYAVDNAGQATGENTRCSYNKVDKGELVAANMPDGIVLKRPSAYSTRDLKAILQCKESIMFGTKLNLLITHLCYKYH